MKAPRIKRSKVKDAGSLSNFAFNFNLRRYTQAFFKADAKADARRKAGEMMEDEAEMSEDGGHTDDEEEVEFEEGEDGATEKVIKRKKLEGKRGGLMDREELEEMVDYIDFNDDVGDDERRGARRAAAHAKFEVGRCNSKRSNP